MTSKILTAALGVISLAGLAAPVRADLLVQLDQTSLTGAPGDTLMFNATLLNTSSTDTIFLNGAGSTASSPFLSIDVSPFFLNAPLSLDPGASSGPFVLFDVTIDPSAPDGPYVGNLVSIQGGADGGAFDDLADVPFDVTVQSSAVPEPSTFPLLAVGVAAFLFVLRGRNPTIGSPGRRTRQRIRASANSGLSARKL
jgi:hypothetical protein